LLALVLVGVSVGLSNFAGAIGIGVAGANARTKVEVAIVFGAFEACYLGYGLDVDAVGKGYMTETLAAALTFVFDTLRLHRVMANYMPSNERSAAVLRRLGFRVEGYAKDYLEIDGTWRDHILTALNADEWARRRTAT